jgi:phage gpG-like protein
MEVLVSVKGLDGIDKRFSRFARNLEETRPVFMEISEALAKSNKRAYGRGVQLAEQTVETKARKGLPPEALVATGDLKASLTESSAKGAIREITPHEMRFGTSIFYSRFINYGVPGHNMPAHKVLKLTPTVRKLIKSLLREHLLGE